MAGFVKLDAGILDSTVWVDLTVRNVFLTALLMAEPYELAHPTEQLQVDSLECTDWTVPAGWYGIVRAAGPGIVRRSGVDHDAGMAALRCLGEPDLESRSQEFEGRRLVRVDGGYLVLNYIRYRERDYTAAERMRLHRAAERERHEQWAERARRHRAKVRDTAPDAITLRHASSRSVTHRHAPVTQNDVTSCPGVTRADSKANTEVHPESELTSVTPNSRNVRPNVTQAEAEAEAESQKLPAPDGAGTEKPKVKTGNPRTTWLTPYLDAWREAMGGEYPPKRLAGELRPLRQQYVDDVVLPAFTRFVAAKRGDPNPEKVTVAQFVRTFGTWANDGKPADDSTPAYDAEGRPAAWLLAEGQRSFGQ